MNLKDVKEIADFKKAAEEYCKVLETDPTDLEEWAMQLLSALAMLYAFGHALPDVECSDDDVDVPDEFKSIDTP